MRRLTGDRGSTALFVAVFAPAMIFMAGLVIDGGSALEARQRAADIAEQAARAAAAECDEALLRSTSDCRIVSQARVEDAVGPYRNSAGVTSLDAVLSSPVRREGGQFHGVQVTVVMTFDTTLLGIMPSFRTLTVRQTAEAIAVTGL